MGFEVVIGSEEAGGVEKGTVFTSAISTTSS